MSTPVSALVDDAAMAIGDPNKQRVATPQWISIYNRSNRELCQKANVLRFLDEFDLVNLDPDTGELAMRYDYPDGMTVMNGIHVSDTPTDPASFRWLKEMFQDEFRVATSGSYPVDSLPTYYFATSDWLYLIGAVAADILDGACIDYFGLPDRVTDLSGVIQVPDMAQDYLIRRMIIHGKMARHNVVEARAELEMWEEDMVSFQDKLDDRSQDRPSSIAPRRNRLAGMR